MAAIGPCSRNPQPSGKMCVNPPESSRTYSVSPRLVAGEFPDSAEPLRFLFFCLLAYLVKDQDPKSRFEKLRKLYEFFSECEVPEVSPSGHSKVTQSRGKLGERFS